MCASFLKLIYHRHCLVVHLLLLKCSMNGIFHNRMKQNTYLKILIASIPNYLSLLHYLLANKSAVILSMTHLYDTIQVRLDISYPERVINFVQNFDKQKCHITTTFKNVFFLNENKEINLAICNKLETFLSGYGKLF